MTSLPLAIVLPLLSACTLINDVGGFHFVGSDAGSVGDAGATCDGGLLCGGSYNYVFMTSKKFTPGAAYSGNGSTTFQGLLDADQICNDLAKGSTVLPHDPERHYVAWLSTSTIDAKDRLVTPDRMKKPQGWIRPDGLPFADSIDALTETGQIFYPLRIDEDGSDVVQAGTLGPDVVVATGTDALGTYSAAIGSAQDWSANAQYGYGLAAATTVAWTQQTQGNTGPAYLYCFGTDLSTPLVIAKAKGRVAFISKGGFSVVAGESAADSLCNTEAQEVGFPGSYLALLSTTSRASSSLFPQGATWVRPDGVSWLATATDLAGGKILTALNVDSSGTYRSDAFVWTGSMTPGALSPDSSWSCTNWTAAGQNGITGQAYASDFNFFDKQKANCARTDLSIYCLQATPTN